MWRISFLSLAIGCASPSAGGLCALDAADYDQTCTVDADCTAIYQGDLCDHPVCTCPNGAISVESRDRYEADFAAITHVVHVVNVCDCAAVAAHCSHGTCGL